MNISEIRRQLVGKVLAWEDADGNIIQRRIISVWQTIWGNVIVDCAGDVGASYHKQGAEDLCIIGHYKHDVVWEDFV